MIRSRWLAVQAATIALAVFAVPSAHAQGRCPALSMQFQTQTFGRVPQMPQFSVPQFQPMLTPMRMPMANFQLPRQSFVPNYNVGFQTPRFNTPAFHMPAYNVRVPTFTPSFNSRTTTNWQTNTYTQNHTLRFPTLQFNYQTRMTRTPNYFVPTRGYTSGLYGGSRFNWNLTMGIKLIPTLGFGTARWTTTSTTRTPFNTTRWTGNMTTGNRLVNIPSLSFNRRPPSFVPTTRPPFSGTTPATVKRPPAFTPTTAQVRLPRPSIPAATTKPGTLTPSTQVTSRLNFSCGSCHNCKQNTRTTPNLTLPQPLVPIVRRPVLPVQLPAPVLLPRPLPTLVGQIPIVRQPLMPLVLISGLQPLPPAPLTIFTTPRTNSIATTKLMTTPEKRPVYSSTSTSLISSLYSERNDTPPLVETTPAKPSMPLVVADLTPPPLPPIATANKLQLPSVIDLMATIESDKAVTRTPRQPQGPSLVQALLLPPPLPSGGAVTPVDTLQPVLDVPPVLPALVDTLIQPPALPPLPGA